jgi:hypothetical protein
VAAIAALVLVAGCSDGGGGSGGGGNGDPAGPAARAGATVEVAQPAICGAGTVISASEAETGTPVTVEEMQALLLTRPAAKPEGFRSQTVVVDEGLGSFRISAPPSFSPFWRFGTSSDELEELGFERDEAWMNHWKDRIDSGGVNTRAISLDTERTDQVVALLVTLTPAGSESGDSLATDFAEGYAEGGALLGESCGIRANGADGAYVEHTVPRDLLDSEVDRTQLQFLIPDPPNDALWGVTCDVPLPLASELKELCSGIAGTFEPLPAIAP